MKTRIISALVGTVLLLAVLFCPYTWVFTLAAAALAAIAVWELLHNTGIVKNKLLLFGSVAFSALMVYAAYAAQEVSAGADPTLPLPANALVPLVLMLLAVYALFVLLTWLACCKAVTFTTVAVAFLLTLYATAGFASLAALRVYDNAYYGLIRLLFALVIPWTSDIGAYFTGMLFGKHKMAPVVSPKKTWEGFFGGWAFSVGSSALLAVIFNLIYNRYDIFFSVTSYALTSLVLAPLSVLGDLFASLIKRRCGIKDYGNIMPGHGGVMDRFDSVVLIAPLLYLMVCLFG